MLLDFFYYHQKHLIKFNIEIVSNKKTLVDTLTCLSCMSFWVLFFSIMYGCIGEVICIQN